MNRTPPRLACAVVLSHASRIFAACIRSGLLEAVVLIAASRSGFTREASSILLLNFNRCTSSNENLGWLSSISSDIMVRMESARPGSKYDGNFLGSRGSRSDVHHGGALQFCT